MLRLFTILNFASVQLGFSVVIYSHEYYVAGIFCNLCGILLAKRLVVSSVVSVVELKFDDEGGLADVATRNHHKVSISLAGDILAVDDIFIPCPYICHCEHTSQGVFVVVGEDARILIMCDVDGLGHSILVARYGGVEEEFGVFYCICQRSP